MTQIITTVNIRDKLVEKKNRLVTHISNILSATVNTETFSEKKLQYQLEYSHSQEFTSTDLENTIKITSTTEKINNVVNSDITISDSVKELKDPTVRLLQRSIKVIEEITNPATDNKRLVELIKEMPPETSNLFVKTISLITSVPSKSGNTKTISANLPDWEQVFTTEDSKIRQSGVREILKNLLDTEINKHLLDRVRYWYTLSFDLRVGIFDALDKTLDYTDKESIKNLQLGIQILMENNHLLNKWFDKSHNNNNFELPNNLIDNMPYVNKVQTKEGVKRMITFDKNLLTSDGSNNLQYIQMNAQNMTFNNSSINIFDTSANFSTFLICNKSNSEKPIYFHNYDPSKEQLDSSDIPKYPQKKNYTITDNYTRDSFFNISTSPHCDIGSLGRVLDTNTNYVEPIKDYSISDIFFTTQESEYKHNIYPESECWDDATTIQIIPKRAGTCVFNSEGNYTRPDSYSEANLNSSTMYRDLNYYTLSSNLDDKKYKRVNGTENLYYNQFLNYQNNEYEYHDDRVLKFDPSFNFTLGLSKEGLREKYIIDNSLDNINITIDTKTSMAISDFMFISDKLSQDERIEIYRYLRNKKNVGQGEIDRYKVNSLITDNSYNFPNRINTKNKLLFWFDSDDIYNLNIQDNLKIEFIVKIFLELETINDIIYFIQNILPSHFDEMLDKIKNNSVYLNNFINLLKNTKLVNNDFIYSDNFIELTRNLYIITDLLSLNKDDTNNDIVGYNYNKEKKIGTYCYIDNTDISFVKDIVDNTYTLLLDISCCADNFEIDVSNINYVKNNVINSVNDFNITDESIREDFRNLSVFQQKSLLYYALKDDYNKRIVNILYYSNPNINDYSYNVYIFKDKSPNNINIETNCNEQSTRHSKFKLIDDYSLNNLNLPINRRLVIDGGSDGLLYRNNLIDKTNHNMFTQSFYIVARFREDADSGKTTLMKYDNKASGGILKSSDNIQYTVTVTQNKMRFKTYMGGTTWPGAYVFKSSGSDDNFYTVTGDDANNDPYKITDTSNESQNINFDNYTASGEVIVPNPNVFKGNKYLNSPDTSKRFDRRFAYFDEGKRLRSDEDSMHMGSWESGDNRLINNRKGSYYNNYDWEPNKANLIEYTLDGRRKYVEANSSNYKSETTYGYLGENGFLRYSINSGSNSILRNSIIPNMPLIIPDETDWNNPNYHNRRDFIELPNAGFTSIGNNYDICELIITNQPLNDDEHGEINKYLVNKWKIPNNLKRYADQVLKNVDLVEFNKDYNIEDISSNTKSKISLWIDSSDPFNILSSNQYKSIEKTIVLDEDSNITFDISHNIPINEIDDYRISIFSNVNKGIILYDSLSLSDNSFTYKPNNNVFGLDTLIFNIYNKVTKVPTNNSYVNFNIVPILDPELIMTYYNKNIQYTDGVANDLSFEIQFQDLDLPEDYISSIDENNRLIVWKDKTNNNNDIHIQDSSGALLRFTHDSHPKYSFIADNHIIDKIHIHVENNSSINKISSYSWDAIGSLDYFGKTYKKTGINGNKPGINLENNTLFYDVTPDHARVYHIFMVVQHPFNITKDLNQPENGFFTMDIDNNTDKLALQYGGTTEDPDSLFTFYYTYSGNNMSNSYHIPNVNKVDKNKAFLINLNFKIYDNNKGYYSMKYNNIDTTTSYNNIYQFPNQSQKIPDTTSVWVLFGGGTRRPMTTDEDSRIYTSGLLGEFILFNKQLSDSSINSINEYLINKWDIDGNYDYTKENDNFTMINNNCHSRIDSFNLDNSDNYIYHEDSSMAKLFIKPKLPSLYFSKARWADLPNVTPELNEFFQYDKDKNFLRKNFENKPHLYSIFVVFKQRLSDLTEQGPRYSFIGINHFDNDRYIYDNYDGIYGKFGIIFEDSSDKFISLKINDSFASIRQNRDIRSQYYPFLSDSIDDNDIPSSYIPSNKFFSINFNYSNDKYVGYINNHDCSNIMQYSDDGLSLIELESLWINNLFTEWENISSNKAYNHPNGRTAAFIGYMNAFDLGEIIIFNTELTQQERDDVGEYLNKKWYIDDVPNTNDDIIKLEDDNIINKMEMWLDVNSLDDRLDISYSISELSDIKYGTVSINNSTLTYNPFDHPGNVVDDFSYNVVIKHNDNSKTGEGNIRITHTLQYDPVIIDNFKNKLKDITDNYNTSRIDIDNAIYKELIKLDISNLNHIINTDPIDYKFKMLGALDSEYMYNYSDISNILSTVNLDTSFNDVFVNYDLLKKQNLLLAASSINYSDNFNLSTTMNNTDSINNFMDKHNQYFLEPLLEFKDDMNSQELMFKKFIELDISNVIRDIVLDDTLNNRSYKFKVQGINDIFDKLDVNINNNKLEKIISNLELYDNSFDRLNYFNTIIGAHNIWNVNSLKNNVRLRLLEKSHEESWAKEIIDLELINVIKDISNIDNSFDKFKYVLNLDLIVKDMLIDDLSKNGNINLISESLDDISFVQSREVYLNIDTIKSKTLLNDRVNEFRSNEYDLSLSKVNEYMNLHYNNEEWYYSIINRLDNIPVVSDINIYYDSNNLQIDIELLGSEVTENGNVIKNSSINRFIITSLPSFGNLNDYQNNLITSNDYELSNNIIKYTGNSSNNIDYIKYKIKDSFGLLSNEGIITIYYLKDNVDLSFTVHQDISFNISLPIPESYNFTELVYDISVNTPVTIGTVSNTVDLSKNIFNYDPPTGQGGIIDQFTVECKHNSIVIFNTICNINILENKPPIAIDISLAMESDTNININLLGFDTYDLSNVEYFIDNSNITLFTDTNPNLFSSGSLKYISDNVLTFTTSPNIKTTEIIKYKVKDSFGVESQEASISILIDTSNIVQIFNGEAKNITQIVKSSSVFNKISLYELQNNGYRYNISKNNKLTDKNGKVSIMKNNIFYTPVPKYIGYDKFEYEIVDLEGNIISKALIYIIIHSDINLINNNIKMIN